MLTELMYFIKERHNVYCRRTAGKPKPWTEDKILQMYRFCNIYRELDKETIWLHDNWLTTFERRGHAWFAAAIARHINLGTTLAQLPYPVPWKPKPFQKALEKAAARGTAFSGAYMIVSHAEPMPRPAYVCRIGDLLWQQRHEIEASMNALTQMSAALCKVYHIGTFMAGQIIADAKWLKPLTDADDWETFAVSGPGSRRGMNRMLHRPKDSPWKEQDWYKHVLLLRQQVNEKLPSTWRKLDAQNLQNCLCEFDKYMRVIDGEGRPKAKYPGV
jgi:hypothetical protein